MKDYAPRMKSIYRQYDKLKKKEEKAKKKEAKRKKTIGLIVELFWGGCYALVIYFVWVAILNLRYFVGH